MKYKAVIFDLDGTLLNTIDDLADSMNHALKRLKFPTHDIESYKLYVGDGIINLALRVLPEGKKDDKIVGRCLEYMADEYSRRWNNKTRLYPGIEDLLFELTIKKIKKAILSNKPDEFTRIVVDTYLKKWEFDIARGARRSMPIKPDPLSAIEISNELGVSPQEIVYVGDTDTDMKTAVSAEMRPVGVLWGFRSGEELKKHGAKLLLNKPLELMQLFA